MRIEWKDNFDIQIAADVLRRAGVHPNVLESINSDIGMQHALDVCCSIAVYCTVDDVRMIPLNDPWWLDIQKLAVESSMDFVFATHVSGFELPETDDVEDSSSMSIGDFVNSLAATYLVSVEAAYEVIRSAIDSMLEPIGNPQELMRIAHALRTSSVRFESNTDEPPVAKGDVGPAREAIEKLNGEDAAAHHGYPGQHRELANLGGDDDRERREDCLSERVNQDDPTDDQNVKPSVSEADANADVDVTEPYQHPDGQ